MITPIEEDVVRIQNLECQESENHLDGKASSVNEVSIEEAWV